MYNQVIKQTLDMEVTYMKKKIKRFIAAVTAITAVAFGGISASATTADDVIAAARGAGILETYVAQLENFLRANNYTSDQYDKMIGGIGNIRNISLSVIQAYFPEVQSVEEFFGGGGSSNNGSDSSSNNGDVVDKLDKNEQPIKNKAEEIVENMTPEQMLEAIDEIIKTGKEIGLDVTVEQTGEKSYILTAKDKDGNVKLVMPIGKLVSRTGIELPDAATLGSLSDYSDNGFLTVSVVCASVIAVGGIGAWILSRKNKIGE